MADKHSTSKTSTWSTLPKYEGFRNYPTWNVNLWLQNEESSYRYWTARAREIYEAARRVIPRDEVHRKAVIALASEIQGVVESNMPEITGMYADLLNFALRYVDWCEVAEQLIEDE